MSTLEKEQMSVHVRWMIRRDMPEIMQIENGSFEFPWTEEEFLTAQRQRNCIGMVAEKNEKILGYMIYTLHKKEIHLLNFAVHPSFRRYGIGSQIIAKLVSKLSNFRRTDITLEVRDSNLTAQLFLRSLGFKATQVLRKYYEDSGDDAYSMLYRLKEEKENYAPIE